MESAVRYDFSFPPKSTSLSSNNNSANLHTVSSNVNTCGTAHVSHTHSHNMFNHRNNYQQNTAYTNNATNSHLSAQHANTQHVGLSKSASTSLLTTCAAHNNNNNNNNPKYVNNNYCNSCHTTKTDSNLTTNNNNNNAFNLNNKSALMSGKNGCNMPKNQSYQQKQDNVHPAINGAPATPKDGNCSFSRLN